MHELVSDFTTEVSTPWLVNVGGKKMPTCEMCNETGATVYCENDKANLCSGCDDKIHNNKDVNVIVSRHKRSQVKDIEWYTEGAHQFFEAVHLALKEKKPKYSRPRKLVALPLVGTGKGGAEKSTGGMVVALLKELYVAAEKYQFDIALVTIKYPIFAAIQVQRNRLAQEKKLWDAYLDDRLKREGERLAALAREGNLVLFMGSGVSASGGSGLPTWDVLLADLAKQTGMTTSDIEIIKTMNYLDAAQVIEIKMGGSKQLTTAVANRVKVHTISLACALLAGLNVREVVTTNYNTMYEMACERVGIKVAVLPYSPASNCERWILKLHGCITHPDDIVLTREHYMRYATRRSALSGIVQSLLITRHMLFVGFSLKDDNFHRIIDEVRRSVRKDESLYNFSEVDYNDSVVRESSNQVVPPKPEIEIETPKPTPKTEETSSASLSETQIDLSSLSSSLNSSLSSISPRTRSSLDKDSDKESGFLSRKFGTQLSLSENPITSLLWDQDVIVLAMNKTTSKDDKFGSARKLEIFLDYLLSLATSTTAFLLNPKYAALLSDPQKELRYSLLRFVESLSHSARDAQEFQLVKHLLEELGWKSKEDRASEDDKS